MKIFLRLIVLLCSFATPFVFAQNDQQSDIIILKDEKQEPPKPVKPDLEMPAEKPPNAPQTFAAFYENWRAFETANRTGNAAQEREILNRILELKQANSIPAISDIAVSAVQFGNAALERDPREAAILFQTATQLDPSLAYAYFCLSKAQLSQGITGVIPAIGSAIRGLLAPTKSFTGSIYFKSKIKLLLTGTLVVLGFCFAFVMLLKYNRQLRHDAVETYSGKYYPSVVQIAVFVILFLPLVVFFGIFWLTPFWILVFWGYGRMPERILGIFLIIDQ